MPKVVKAKKYQLKIKMWLLKGSKFHENGSVYTYLVAFGNILKKLENRNFYISCDSVPLNVVQQRSVWCLLLFVVRF